MQQIVSIPRISQISFTEIRRKRRNAENVTDVFYALTREAKSAQFCDYIVSILLSVRALQRREKKN